MNKFEYLSKESIDALCELDRQLDTAALASLLIRYLQKPFTLQKLWQYRPYIRKLSEPEILSSPVLLCASAVCFLLEGSFSDADRLIQMLPEGSKYRTYCTFMMPTYTWTPFFAHAKTVIENGWGPLPNLSITAGRPYVRNGFRDVTPAWEAITSNSDQTAVILRAIYGDRWKNAFKLAQAEALYWRDERFESLMQVVNTLPLLTTNKDDTSLLFPALFLQANILVMNGQTESVVPAVAALRAQLHKTGREELLPNVDAMEAHAALYDSDYARVAAWMRNGAPDEISDFCLLDIYRYLVKLRVYIVQQKHLAFTSLAARLLPHLVSGHRVTDECELQVLWAISDHMRGDKSGAYQHLQRALALAEQYRLDRMLADEGEQILRLLLLYRKEKGSSPYIDTLIPLARKVASLYPRYLKFQLPETPSLSETELIVLRFLADGRSNADIADLLDVQVDTVKAHCKHIAKKLQTKNRHQAVSRAVELGILEPATPGTAFSDADIDQ